MTEVKPLSYRQRSFIYLANPSVKFVTVFALSFLFIWPRNLPLLIALSIFFSALYLLFANLRLRWLLWLFISVLAMSFLSGVNLFLFGSGSDVIWQFAWWKISYESLYSGLIVVFRTLLMGMMGLLFSTTTNPVLFCYSLMQQLRVSPNIAYGCLATMRMVPLMVQEFRQLQKALTVRGAKRQRGIVKYWHWLFRIMLVLLAQAMRRAYRTSLAVVTKKFDGKAARTYYYRSSLSRNDIYFMAVVVGGCAALAVWAYC